jgi:hypothetical protein
MHDARPRKQIRGNMFLQSLLSHFAVEDSMV